VPAQTGDLQPVADRVEIAAHEQRVLGGSLQQAQQLWPGLREYLLQELKNFNAFSHDSTRNPDQAPAASGGENRLLPNRRARSYRARRDSTRRRTDREMDDRPRPL